MSPAGSTAVALVALLLAVAAIILATIANRRWASRASGTRGPGTTHGLAPLPGTVPGTEASPATDRPGADAAIADERTARESLAAAVAVLRSEVHGLAEHVDSLGARSTAAGEDLEAVRARVELLAAAEPVSDPTALRHVALVRYDAFADVGGRLSYSVALLDDTGSGLVLTTLSGKSDVRTYVRTISAGTPDGSLTAEEQQAIDAAVGSRQ